MPHKRKDLKIEGSNLWYLVGLITSDGYLSSDGRHIDITSKDYNFLNELIEKFNFVCKVCIKNRGTNNQAYRIQIANKKFYEFLLSVGLMQNKSLVLEQIKIPEIHFFDFLRGLIDGDGGIQRWTHHTNKREQWNLRVASGSRKFLVWLKNEIEKIMGVKGRLYFESKTQFRLKYGKMAARIIAQKCYYDGSFALRRKKDLARECINSYLGWRQSKTILN
jgi:hypothetical protein